jgi:hypothetical protein
VAELAPSVQFNEPFGVPLVEPLVVLLVVPFMVVDGIFAKGKKESLYLSKILRSI